MKRTIAELNSDIDYFRERIQRDTEDIEAQAELTKCLEELATFDAKGQELFWEVAR